MNAEHDTQWPAEVGRAPDIRIVELQSEILRCARVLRWVEALPAGDLVSPRTPIVADDLVSVVVPMYNARRWIESCLKGLLAQRHRNLEIFCVDDCSNDDTYEHVIDRFGRDGRLCVVRLAQNVGPFQISNWAAGWLARGRRIAWQDADNVSHPARIEAESRFMERQQFRISGTGVHHFFSSPTESLWSDKLPVEADGLLHELLLHRSLRSAGQQGSRPESAEDWSNAWQRNELDKAGIAVRGSVPPAFHYLSRYPCNHGSQMVDTALFREFGGFEGRTKLNEDQHFDWRVSRFHDIGNLPQVVCSRRSHSDSLTRDPATGRNSPARLRHRDEMRAKQERITRELRDGNTARARELCTESLYRAEIRIERAHLGFDIALS